MNHRKGLSRAFAPALALLTLSIAACASSAPEQDQVGETSEAIVAGTITNLGANSFVRLASPGCTGTLIDNHWILTANHCTSNVGDPVYMDNQVGTVARVVPNPDAFYDVDVALLKLAAPMAIGGSTTGFRRALRTTVVAPGTHVRCFGYGETWNGPGINPQLRRMELGTTGGANNTYFLEQNSLGQSAAPGDAGGGCLDDYGYLIGVMRSMPWSPTAPGETAMVTSQYYATWVSTTLSACYADSDCATGVCKLSTHQCVSSTCFDGVRDNGETGIDCGGSCAPCSHCPKAMVDCGDGTCAKWAYLCR